MVDQSGAAELTRPVVKGGTFIAATERIYLSTGIANDGIEIDRTSDVAVEFEPEVAKLFQDERQGKETLRSLLDAWGYSSALGSRTAFGFRSLTC